jgi:glycine cleavage system H protein
MPNEEDTGTMKTRRDHQKGFPLIPEGDKRCVWMDIGVVSYKICDRDFDCDNCPLNQGLAGSSEPPGDVEGKKDEDRLSREGIPAFSQLMKIKTLQNRYYHPNHTWIKVEEPDDRVVIGIDDIVAAVFGSIDQVSFPACGKRIERNGVLCRIIQEERIFEIHSPVSGEVMKINEELKGFPNKLIIDSMRGGWLAILNPYNLQEDIKHCRDGDSVFPWYLKELEWFDSIIVGSFKRQQESVGHTMYDGGELSRNLRDVLPPEQYRLLVLSLLGE